MRFLAVLAAAVVAGCASGGSSGGGGATVVVENDLAPPTAITVYVVDEFDNRRSLGNVSPLDQRAFRLPESSSGQYRLVARTTSGSEITSQRFALFAGETADWRLSANLVD
jgi:hypothetical protein